MSRKFSDTQQRWPTHEKEMFSIIAVLEYWRHHLIGSPRSQVYSDHRSLTHFQDQRDLTPKQARWMERFQEFNAHVDYIPGKSNVVADALSRHPGLLAAISTATKALPARIKAAYEHDPHARTVLKAIATGNPHWAMERGYIVRIREDERRIYVPDHADLRRALAYEYHDASLASHLGVAKTYANLSATYFWPGMQKYIHDYVAACTTCAANKESTLATPGLLAPLPIPERNWDTLTVDFIVGLPKTPRGHDCILNFVDKRSKMIHLVPCATTITALEFAHVYMNTIVRAHGMQLHIVSDRDPKFTSSFWTEFTGLLGTKLKLSTAFHPQTDGQTERANRTVEEMLRSSVNWAHNDWDIRLAAWELAYNNSVNPSTGKTPFQLNYGNHPRLPATLDFLDLTSPNAAASELVVQLKVDQEEVTRALVRAQQSQAAYANSRRRDVSYAADDWFMLSTRDLTLKHPSRKLAPRYVGPFRITKVISRHAYELDLPQDWQIHPVVNITRLKPVPSDARFPQPKPRPPPLKGKPDVFLVDHLVARRVNASTGRPEYLVKWHGYPSSENTWEPYANLTTPAMQEMAARLEAESASTTTETTAAATTAPRGRLLRTRQ